MIGERLKQLRKSLSGLTQAEFAKPLEIPYTAISKYETGNINPSSEVLSKIGKIYHVNLNWLLTGEGEMFLSEPPLSKKIMELIVTIQHLDPSYQEQIFTYIEERKKLSIFDKKLNKRQKVEQ